MKKYRCLVADDNMVERDLLVLHLEKMPALDIVAVCENGFEASQILNEQDIDIVFSDIEMPDLTGFGLLKSLKKKPVFVFISSHGAYAVESYNLDVIDFIVKPVSFERLLKAVNKATEYIETKKSAETNNAGNAIEKEPDYFYIRESNDLLRLFYKDVAYIESMGNFSKIFMLNGKHHITLVNLKNLELQLPPAHFIRIHKQYIINHTHISAISTDEIRIADKYLVPFSQTFRQELMDKIVHNNIVTRNLQK